MKKRYLLLLATVLVIVLGIFVVPVIFKDDIRALINRQLEQNINATVYFDEEQFDLSLFGNFPNLTVEVGDFGIIGQEEFAGDTLAHIDLTKIELDLKSVLFEEQIQVKSISLSSPKFLIKILADGKANYDIAKSNGEEPEASTDSSSVSIGINAWTVTQGELIYEDLTLPFKMALSGIEHTGSGDFTLDIFDMDTYTEAEKLFVTYDGIEYLSGVKVKGNVKLGMDLPQSKYSFKENDIHLNDFGLSFAGDIIYPDENLDMNINFASQENTFKSLLSLVPSIYSNNFNKLETSGSLMFEGGVKGRYNEETMPSFTVSLSIADGKFHYPELPDEVHDVNTSIQITAPQSADYEELSVSIPRFEFYMGNNPIKGNMSLKGLSKYELDANVNGKLNLEEFGKIYPIEGLDMKGLFTMGLQANGIYDEARNKMPKVKAQMLLENGYIKSADYPIPMEQITFKAKAASSTGTLGDFNMQIEEASLMMDGKPLRGSGSLSNLNDPTYDLNLNGEIDLGIIEKISPIDGMTLKGHITANISTKGKMSAIEAEKYDQLPTKGSLLVENLEYKDTDLPQGIRITRSELNFNPQSIVLKEYTGYLGKSDIQMQGNLFNYLAYALKDDESLLGSLEISSNSFNTNEWMVDESGEDVEEDTEEYGVVALPKNINFKMGINAQKAIYEKFELSEVVGTMHLKDGVLDMSQLNFKLYGGSFSMSGLYDPRDLKNPLFDVSFGIQNLAFIDAYQQFSSIQKMAPVLSSLDGTLSTKFKLSGKLGEDLMPISSSLNGKGALNILNASFTSTGTILEKAQSLSGISKLKDASIQNLKAAITVENGSLNIAPEKFQLAGYQAEIGGQAGVDGTLDFDFKLNLPGNDLPSSLSGVSTALIAQDTIPLNFKIKGSYNRPLVGLDTDAIKGLVKSKLKGEVDQAKDEAKDKAKEAAEDLIKDKVGSIFGKPDSKDSTIQVSQDSTVQDSTSAKKKIEEAAKDKLKDLKNKFPFKKKDN